MKFCAALVCAFLLGSSGTLVSAEPLVHQASTDVLQGSPSRPIQAWEVFCKTPVGQAECAVNTQEPDQIVYSPEIRRLLNKVSRSVNMQILPLTDIAHWGVSDHWDIPDDGFGDCEDYQLLKRQLLVRAGLPRRALRMTVVIDENNDGHAVLMARTTAGDFILDNQRNDVRLWSHTGYIYVKRESSDFVGWVNLGNVAANHD